jgi:hypothetical protein
MLRVVGSIIHEKLARQIGILDLGCAHRPAICLCAVRLVGADGSGVVARNNALARPGSWLQMFLVEQWVRRVLRMESVHLLSLRFVSTFRN